MTRSSQRHSLASRRVSSITLNLEKNPATKYTFGQTPEKKLGARNLPSSLDNILWRSQEEGGGVPNEFGMLQYGGVVIQKNTKKKTRAKALPFHLFNIISAKRAGQL